MSNTVQTSNAEPTERAINVRLPDHLIDAIESHRVTMATRSPGVKITTSDAVRALLIVGLDAA